MIEIAIILIIWVWGITPLWINILVTILLSIRFSWRALLTLLKLFEFNKEKENGE